MTQQNALPGIVYSCYHTVSRGGEQFIPEHTFSYQVSGTLTISDGIREYQIPAGTFRFTRRNQLAKFLKHPPEGGEFKSISILLDQETLRGMSMEYGYTGDKDHACPGVVPLASRPLYKSYMDGLMSYVELPAAENKALITLKVKEAVLILLRYHPALKDILFDFSAPGKIDLEAFMQQHYHFNVGLHRFAYLTGRSLATFKRDFEKIFHTSPGNWLLQRRLQEAHYLIKEKGKKPSDVYLDVGFEDLSHFSFAFKNAFGKAPSRI